MAEAVASILTIIALAKPVSILSKTIYEIARGSKIVRADMRSARRQLNLFVNLVRHAAKSLQRYIEDGSAPASARWLAQYHVLGDLASETKHLEQGVYRQREKMQRLRSWTWDFWRSLRWILMQPEFVKLQRNLQMFTALLSLALTTCMFEEATAHEGAADTADLAGLALVLGEWGPGDVQRAVCHLATSMVETGAVPTTHPKTFIFRARPRVRRSSNTASEAGSAVTGNRKQSEAVTRGNTPKAATSGDGPGRQPFSIATGAAIATNTAHRSRGTDGGRRAYGGEHLLQEPRAAPVIKASGHAHV
ncbi:unnamed protein product [Parascedosporium putredinis]|uniref:Uncharacterized protein n=1 Tax=Parascedosporium putredinis TaxID=1442378 RepID=A0A9P1M9A5_9PEZI|nr:unnamed protein product [Parascedosporium putredinis]CAI7991573.1 unnamed protein product [Parascedosporium putredinis]